MDDDSEIFKHINELAAEEEQLWGVASAGDGLDADQVTRLDRLKVELDRCYDLLHQRQARRAAGLDPEEAKLRPEDVVERYQQ
jgi:uncharacterized protein DUF2630